MMKKTIKVLSIPFLTIPLFTVAALAHAETKLSGFADIQYSGATDAWDEQGIYLNDAAIYLNHTAGSAEFLLDLPFSSSAGESLLWAQEKVQAYLKLSFTPEFAIQTGQFDTLFGFEANDSKDLHFSAGGLLYNNVLPTSHMGLMGIYSVGAAKINLFAANPDNQGILSGKNPDLGIQIAYEIAEDDPISVGALISSEGGKNKTLLNIVGGFDVTENLRADLEFDIVSDPALADTTLGYLLNLEYSLSEKHVWGLRTEYLFNGRNDETPTHSQFMVAVGPKCLVNENLSLKAEYNLGLNRTAEGSDNKVINGARVSAVYSF